MEKNTEKLIIDSIDSIRKDITDIRTNISILNKSMEDHEKTDLTSHNNLSSLVKDMQYSLKYLESSFDLIDEHIEKENTHLLSAILQLKTDSFPLGDAAGHKSYHEVKMNNLKDSAEIKKDVKKHILKGVFWAIVVGLFWASVNAVKEWIKK